MLKGSLFDGRSVKDFGGFEFAVGALPICFELQGSATCALTAFHCEASTASPKVILGRVPEGDGFPDNTIRPSPFEYKRPGEDGKTVTPYNYSGKLRSLVWHYREHSENSPTGVADFSLEMPHLYAVALNNCRVECMHLYPWDNQITRARSVFNDGKTVYASITKENINLFTTDKFGKSTEHVLVNPDIVNTIAGSSESEKRSPDELIKVGSFRCFLGASRRVVIKHPSLLLRFSIVIFSTLSLNSLLCYVTS